MKDYTVIIRWDKKYQSYIAIILELCCGYISFGDTPEEALKEARVSIDICLAEEKNEENRKKA